MNRLSMNKQILAILFSIGAFTLSHSSLNAAQGIDEQCSKDILLAYFPEPFVKETLKKYNVSEDQWSAIVNELTAKDKEIIKQVEAKADKLNPNPLKDPQQRQAAVKIFRDTLLENFSTVLKSHGIQDDKQIQAMLDDIQQQKAKRFAQCMESQKIANTPVDGHIKSKNSSTLGQNERKIDQDDEEENDNDEDDGDDESDDSDDNDQDDD